MQAPVPLIETYDKENGNFTMKIHMNVLNKDANDGQKTNVTTAESGPPEDHANMPLAYNQTRPEYMNAH